MVDHPETIGELVLSMRPDFVGRVAGGRWMCVYTWMEPHTEHFSWALGYGATADEARGIAMEKVAETRHAWEIADLVANKL